MTVVKTVKVLVARPTAAVLPIALSFVTMVLVAVVVLEDVKVALLVAEGDEVDDDESCTTGASWDALFELSEGDTTLSPSAVPFHKTVHELALKLLGTWSHMRKSLSPRTVKPFLSVAFPCSRMECRNVAAWSFMLKA